MSVTSHSSRVAYEGNNSTENPYPVPFYFLDRGDLTVVVTNASGVDTKLVMGTDYLVSGEGVALGGSLVTTWAVPGSSRVTIYREVDAVQLTSYEEADAFPAKSHERALDRLTMLCQQVMRVAGRSFRVRESDGDVNEISAVANTIFGLGPTKQPRTYTAAELAVWLNLTQQFFGEGTKTWLSEGDRELAVPDFLGQVGVQMDDASIWVSDGVEVGEWVSPIPGIDDDAITTAKIAAGALAADEAGRGKMADGYLTLAKIASAIFTADSIGRGKFGSGFVNSDLCAAGLWNVIAPAGAVLQTIGSQFATLQTITNQIPSDNTIPQATEGDQVLTATITPSSTSSKILVRASMSGTSNATASFVMAMFRDSSANAFAAARGVGNASDSTLTVEYLDSPSTTSAVVYKMRAGPSTSSTLYINGASGVQIFGGTSRTTITLQEIKG